jgi:hypothetical protein
MSIVPDITAFASWLRLPNCSPALTSLARRAVDDDAHYSFAIADEAFEKALRHVE